MNLTLANVSPVGALQRAVNRKGGGDCLRAPPIRSRAADGVSVSLAMQLALSAVVTAPQTPLQHPWNSGATSLFSLFSCIPGSSQLHSFVSYTVHFL